MRQREGGSEGGRKRKKKKRRRKRRRRRKWRTEVKGREEERLGISKKTEN